MTRNPASAGAAASNIPEVGTYCHLRLTSSSSRCERNFIEPCNALWLLRLFDIGDVVGLNGHAFVFGANCGGVRPCSNSKGFNNDSRFSSEQQGQFDSSADIIIVYSWNAMRLRIVLK